MKKILFLSICLLVTLPFTANATGGALRKNSIKTCPNGITYGMHSDGNGGTHWHVAVTNKKNYYPSGAAINDDPCPNYTKNAGTAGSTNTNSSVSSSTNKSNTIDNPSINNSNNKNDTFTNSSTNSSNSQTNNNTNNSTIQGNSDSISNNNEQDNDKKIIEPSTDNSIKKILVDNEEIVVSDNMNIQTNKKQISINIETTSPKAKVDYDNKWLTDGDNIINIVITSENGAKKNYVLKVTKVKGKGESTIKQFTLGASNVKFDNNKATITKLKNESSLKYSYELSDNDARLIMYLNDNETTELENLKENDKLKLVVIDKNNNENIYEITIADASIVKTYIIYGITTLIMIWPIVGIIITIIAIKKQRGKSKQ